MAFAGRDKHNLEDADISQGMVDYAGGPDNQGSPVGSNLGGTIRSELTYGFEPPPNCSSEVPRPPVIRAADLGD